MRFTVEDMTCGHCTAAIEKAIAVAGGEARADLASHQVEVTGLSPEQAAEVIRAEGYTPVPLAD
ncbi:MAG: heavy-metal-associated domain-containing protein [Paracoccus sp. (in: a-proteobacteria)]|uniref:heavy-metal-associated domain-containing protein n=1 Tax=Paracoccus sp. TaxID=267 RepID=UPI0026DEA651|nr:heavy-metal-associated domain-containing protein [Paracoccus sp. (in: a-proteobacteria)]MDO5622197.1 heavy-metal-associated domain-containing protein [Paracoccus sp. (in: a-proteobacteria)]